MPPFEDNDNVDVYDPLYSTNYERVSDLVVTGIFNIYLNRLIFLI